MALKSLFNDDQVYTEAAMQLGKEIDAALSPVLRAWMDKNEYSYRDIENVAIGCVTLTMSAGILRYQGREYRKRREQAKERLCQNTLS